MVFIPTTAGHRDPPEWTRLPAYSGTDRFATLTLSEAVYAGLRELCRLTEGDEGQNVSRQVIRDMDWAVIELRRQERR